MNVSHVLAAEYVGLEEVADGIWSVYLGPVLLGRFDERGLRIHGAHNRNPLYRTPQAGSWPRVSPMSPVDCVTHVSGPYPPAA